MCIAVAKRGGFKGRKKIPDEKVSGEIKEIRRKAAEENRKNMNPGANARQEQVYVDARIHVFRAIRGVCRMITQILISLLKNPTSD